MFSLTHTKIFSSAKKCDMFLQTKLKIFQKETIMYLNIVAVIVILKKAGAPIEASGAL